MFKRTPARALVVALLSSASLMAVPQAAMADAAPTSVSPTTATNADPDADAKVLTINGTGFTGTPTVSLTHPNVDALVGANVTVLSATQLTARFNITSQAPGTWTPTVQNSGEPVGLCTCTFTLTAAAPTLTSVSPSTRGQGYSGTLSITGTNFWPGVEVAISGGAVSVSGVTRNSATSLTATISVGSSATTGTRTVTATNTDGVSGTCSACLTISAGLAVASMSPPAALNTGSVSTTISGSGFVAGATVRLTRAAQVDITASSVTVNSASSISATFNLNSAAPGPWTVQVTNSDGGVNTCACFSVASEAPTATVMSPSSRGPGAASQTITVTGTNFVNGTAAAFTTGTGVTINSTVVTSRTELTLNVTVAGGASAGPRDLTITNTDGQSGVCESCFTVNATPTATSTTPSSRGRGASSQVISVTGTNFLTGATASFSGSGITVNSTTVVSAEQLNLNITITSGAATGVRDVIVSNGDAGATSTCTGCFTVNAAPTVTGSTPASGGQGTVAQDFVVAGTGFVAGASAAFSGSGITVNSTTFTSSTALTVNATISSGATTGSRNITITNGDAGIGACSSCFTVNTGPAVTSLSPNSRGQGAVSQTVTVSGSGFANGAAVTFSGTGVTATTTFVSATQLTATVSVAGDATVGSRNVTVLNPDGGRVLCSNCFTVNAIPTVVSADPASRGQGASSQNIAVTGTDFVSGASVGFSGAGITVNSTTLVSSTSLTANITIAGGATTGSRDITVSNGDGGSSSACIGCFTVNPAPAATSLSPSSRGQGVTNAVTVTGTDFQNGATVTFSGTGITVNSTTFVSATQIDIEITVGTTATTGSRDATVTNPDGGTPAVCSACFTVNARPTVTSASPSSRGQGAVSQDLALTGTNFAASPTVTFSGTGITVNSAVRDSATQITINVTVSDSAALGARDITVTNADLGAGTCTGCFSVNAKPIVTSVDPASLGRGASGHTITVTGSGFTNPAVVSFSGGDVTVNSMFFVDATTVRVTISIDGAAPSGTRNVIVTNNDGGVGICADCFDVTANPVPNSVSPSAAVNTAPINTTISGAGFVSGATVRLTRSPYAPIDGANVVVVSSSSITARFDITSAAPGSWILQVTNPGDATGSCACFSVAGSTPAVTSASPPSRAQGAPAADVTINGSGFAQGSTVLISGAGVTVNSTSFVSATSLTANITVASGAATGARDITVTNADTQTGTCIGCFNVNASPTVTSALPSSRGQGASNQNVTLAGTGFISGATASFSGTGITVNSTTFDSATQLTVNVTVASDTTIGTRDVSVDNGDGGTVGVCTGCFTVNSRPAVTSLTPANRAQGMESQTVVVTGTGFASGTVIEFSGNGITVNSKTFNSPTQITLNVSIDAAAVEGVRSVTAVNADAGRGTCATCFTVTEMLRATSVSPSSLGQGATSQAMVLDGTGFIEDTTVAFSGTGITINSRTLTSDTQITLNVNLAPGATVGSRTITVTNPGASPVTCADCFTVNAAPTVTSVAPGAAYKGAGAKTIEITGTGFVNGATVTAGAGISITSVTFDSATKLIVGTVISASASLGDHLVAVVNPDAGIGSCAACFVIEAPPEIEITKGSSVASLQKVEFGDVVKNVTSANFVLRASGESSNLPVTMKCRNASGLSVNCGTASVRRVDLTPDAPLIPGGAYKVIVNPAGATPMTDADGVSLPTLVSSLRASTIEQENSPVVDQKWSSVPNAASYGRSYYSTDLIGASAEFSFEGTRIVWYSPKNRSQGKSTVFIDGINRGTFDLYSEESRARASRRFDVPEGEHTLRLLSRGKGNGGSQSSIDAFKVVDGGTSKLFKKPDVEFRWDAVSASAAAKGKFVWERSAGARFLIPFAGKGVAWYTVRGPMMGQAAVYIDGVLVKKVDNYASNLGYGVARTFRGLTPGRHTLEIRVLGTSRPNAKASFIAVDEIRVL